MQPYEVLGVVAMLFAIVGTILQLIGVDNTRGIRAAGGTLLFGLGLIFVILSRQRALALFPYDQFPVGLAKCYAVIMMALWVAILPHMTRRIFRSLAYVGLGACTIATILMFFFAK